MVKTDVRRLNLDMPQDMAAWVSFMSGLKDVSKIAYVCECIRADMERAPEATKEAFAAFLKARDA